MSLLQIVTEDRGMTFDQWLAIVGALTTLAFTVTGGVLAIIRELRHTRRDIQENTVVTRQMNGAAADAAVSAEHAAKAAEKVAVATTDRITAIGVRVEDIATATIARPPDPAP